MPSSLPLSFTGHTIRGAGRGKPLGTPTINVALVDVPESLEHGIYAGRVVIDRELFPAAIHFGPSPVFNAGVSFEVHVLDIEIDEAPDEFHISVDAFLRKVENFKDSAALQAQIEKDIDAVRGMMKTHDRHY